VRQINQALSTLPQIWTVPQK